MRTYQQLIQLRIFHVTIMFATAIFIYQFSQWEQALWIPISVLAIIGPFRAGLTIYKARQRLIGTLAGLLLSIIVWTILYYWNNSLVFIALILVYCVAFSALQEYTYFIMLVSLMICVNFDYTNLFINHEIGFVANRGICVLAGVTLCQFFEYFIFSRYYTNSVALVQTDKLDSSIAKIKVQIEQITIHKRATTTQINKSIALIVKHLNELGELKESCLHGYSNQNLTLELINKYETKLTHLYNWLNNNAFKFINYNRFLPAQE